MDREKNESIISDEQLAPQEQPSEEKEDKNDSPSLPNAPVPENEEDAEEKDNSEEAGEDQDQEQNQTPERGEEAGNEPEDKGRIKTGSDDEYAIERSDEGLAMRFSHGEQQTDELLKTREERETEEAAEEETGPELLVNEEEINEKKQKALEKEAERQEKERAFRKRERRREEERIRKETEERFKDDPAYAQSQQETVRYNDGIPLVEDEYASKIPGGYGSIQTDARTFSEDIGVIERQQEEFSYNPARQNNAEAQQAAEKEEETVYGYGQNIGKNRKEENTGSSVTRIRSGNDGNTGEGPAQRPAETGRKSVRTGETPGAGEPPAGEPPAGEPPFRVRPGAEYGISSGRGMAAGERAAGAGPSPMPASELGGVIIGTAAAASKSRNKDDKDNGVPDTGYSGSKKIQSGVEQHIEKTAGAASRFADGGVEAAGMGMSVSGTGKAASGTSESVIRLYAGGRKKPFGKEMSKVAEERGMRIGKTLAMKKRKDDKVRTGSEKLKADVGKLAQASQDAKKQTAAVRAFQSKNGGLFGGLGPASGSQAQAGPAQIMRKLKTLVKAAAKKIVATALAGTLTTGAVAGGSVMLSNRVGENMDSLWQPVQAHLSADGSGYGKSLTQQTLEYMHARMRAYGIKTNYVGDRQGSYGGPLSIHVPGYEKGFGNGGGQSGGGDGDSTIFSIGKEYFLIDGGLDVLSQMTRDYLKEKGVTELTVMVSHWHTDHDTAVMDILQEGSIKIKTLYCPPPDDIASHSSGDAWRGNWIVNKVKEKGGTVIIPSPNTNTSYTFSGLVMNVWRKPAEWRSDIGSYDVYDFINDASIQVYFPDLYYYTNGDMYYSMDDFLDTIDGSPIKLMKCAHHGEGSWREIPRIKNNFGMEACWFNQVGDFWGELTEYAYARAANDARKLGVKTFQPYGDIEMTANNGIFTIRGYNAVTGEMDSYSYECPYKPSAMGAGTDDVAQYALSWVGENGNIIIPYKSSVTDNDPNGERFMDLQAGRGSDCSWFVYHVLCDCGVLDRELIKEKNGEDFIHSYQWGSEPELYPNGKSMGTDLSQARPGDVLCYGYNFPRKSSNSHVGIYVGNGEIVECAAGAGGVVKSKAPSGGLIDIVHFDTKAGTPKAGIATRMSSTGSVPAGSKDFRDRPDLGFSPETEAIVEEHINDFDRYSFHDVMNRYGGVGNYIKSLGGVFARLYGSNLNVSTAGQFQEVSEYVMGLYTIWGADYWGGGPSTKFNERGRYISEEYGRFYKGMEAGPYTFDGASDIEEILENDERIITDCGSGVAKIMQKAGLYNGYAGNDTLRAALGNADRFSGGGAIAIFKKEDLQVGDLIQFFDSRCDDAFTNKEGWHHVAVVGEVWADGTVICYDTGHAFPEFACWKYEFDVNEDGSLGGFYGNERSYTKWFAVRTRELLQTDGISSWDGMYGDSGVAVQNLGDIRINSVNVDGSPRDPDDFTFKTLGQYKEGGKTTGMVIKKFKFVDKDGEELKISGLTNPFGMTGAQPGSAVDNVVGVGTEIVIPEGYGGTHTYMGWQCITSPSSNQYKLREAAGQNFDEEGFAIINGRYVVATTDTYGKVGDYVDFVKEDGKVLHCILGDVKSRGDAGCNEWGHHNGKNIIEFVVDKNTWYSGGKGSHANPGTSSCHPEWATREVKAVNVGNYYGDTSSGSTQFSYTGSSEDTENAMYLALQTLSMSVLGSRYADPTNKEEYQQYCFDVIDYAVCESGGADVTYTTTGDDSMQCEAEVTIRCDMSLLEENDENFVSWGYKYPDGDPQPASYMILPIRVFNSVFNIDTFAGSKAMNAKPFTGNEEIVYEYFMEKGLNAAQIAGIMANIDAESSFNPESVNKSSGAKGLFQWLGGRAAALDKLAQSQGKDWKDIYCQLDYAWSEIDSPESWGNRDAYNSFMKTTSAKDAAMLFCVHWERPGNAAVIAPKRGEKAEEYYNAIISATMGGSNINYVNWAISIANNDSIGYCQHHRQGNPEYDCSSLVFYALLNSGYNVGSQGSAFNTHGMDGPLASCGFKKMPLPPLSELRPGDILWQPEHTEIYVGNGKKVGAHTNEIGQATREAPQHGDQTKDEISLKEYDYPGSFTHIYRR